LAAKAITTEQAELVHKVVTEYLCDELLAAMSDYDPEVIQNLLVLFPQTEAAPQEDPTEAVTLVNPVEWRHEAIERLYRLDRSRKDPIKAAKLKHHLFHLCRGGLSGDCLPQGNF